MENFPNIVAKGDYFLALLYLILGYFLVRFLFRHKGPRFQKLLLGLYIAKMACSLLMSLMIVFYWQGSDNYFYFNEGHNFNILIRESWTNIKYFFLPVEQYNFRIEVDPVLMSNASNKGMESNFLIAKFCALFYPLALGRYLLVNLCFSVFSTIAQLKMYEVLANRYPVLKKGLALALFIPSILLYSSYINKETICVSFIGFAIYHCYQIAQKKRRLLNVLLLLLNLFLIYLVKIYVIMAIGAALVLILLIRTSYWFWRNILLAKVFILLFWVTAGILLVRNMSYFDPFIVKFVDTSNAFQEGYNSGDGTSAFEFGEIETSFSGIVQKMPLGFYTAYFRPQLWEVYKPILFFSAIESFGLLIMALWALYFKGKYIRRLIRQDFLAYFSILYAILLGVIVGLTTFNYGTLVRYKIPGETFLYLFLLLLMNVPVPEKANKTVAVAA